MYFFNKIIAHGLHLTNVASGECWKIRSSIWRYEFSNRRRPKVQEFVQWRAIARIIGQIFLEKNVFFDKKVRFLKIAVSFISLIPSPISPTEHRQTTERTPTHLPALQKCYLLRFATTIGCLVLAVPPARILATASCLSILPNIIRVFLERLVWLVLLSHTSQSV